MSRRLPNGKNGHVCSYWQDWLVGLSYHSVLIQSPSSAGNWQGLCNLILPNVTFRQLAEIRSGFLPGCYIQGLLLLCYGSSGSVV